MKARRKKWAHGIDAREFAPFVHLIRSPDDPDRRAVARSLGGVKGAKLASYRAIIKRPLEELRADILEALADGTPRTFNRIALEAWDTTADIAFLENPDHALWSLVVDGTIEHTLAAPILFRVRTKKDQDSA